MKHLYCDYLVVGAGTANLSFLDSLLEHHPTATAILIDRNAIPGGHWTTAYPFVRLHQPACWYGVNSMKLGTSRNALGDEIFDNSDRSSSREILSYYAKVVDNFVATKRVRTFFNTEHTELDDDGLNRHVITTPNGEFLVQCAKVVRCETRVIVPSMREVPFPVDQSVTAKSLNHIPDALESGLYSKFLVIGAGKTGTDAIVHLLSSGVNEKDITWIISRDVWYAMRDGLWPSTPGSGKDFYKCKMETMDILARAPSLKEAVLEMEREGQFARLDPNGPAPAVFKGPTIDKDELALALVLSGMSSGWVASGASAIIKSSSMAASWQFPLKTRSSSTAWPRICTGTLTLTSGLRSSIRTGSGWDPLRTFSTRA